MNFFTKILITASGVGFVSLQLAIAKMEKRDYPIDEKISPCIDMYKYACGKTDAAFELPKNRRRHNFSFDDVGEYILSQKKAYFAGLRKISSVEPKERAVQSYYTACMNEEGARKGEKNFVAKTVADIDAIETRDQLGDYLYRQLKKGRFSFLQLYSNIPNLNDWRIRDAYFSISTLSFEDKSYYEKPEIMAGYKNLVELFFNEIGLERAKERANWVADFEAGLAKVYPSGEEIRKNIFAVTEMKPEFIESLDALKIKRLFKELGVRRQVRNFFGEKSFEYLNDSLKTLPIEHLKTVFLYHALRGYLDDAYPTYKKAAVAFNAKHFGGVMERPDRAERCTNEVEARLGKELDAVLMPRLFPSFPKAQLRATVEKIRSRLVQTVANNSWLSEGARKEAALKLTKLNVRLVSPETDEEWGFLPTRTYSSTDSFANHEFYMDAKRQQTLQDLKKTFRGPVWEFGPLHVNAALMPMYNAIVFPVAILQPPFYDPKAPEETNMAAIGSVIGHEIGHAIDDKGYTFNHRGQVRPWVKDEDEKNFFARAEPLIRQFDEIGHNGKFTLGENIGDLVGLSNAYHTAFPAGSSKPVQLKRDFFVQWARLWCEVQRPDLIELRRKVDPHALGFARTNEPLKHIPEYAEAFSCKASDPMVLPAEKRVNIW